FMGIPLLHSDELVQQLLQDIASGIDRNDLLQWGVTLPDSDTLVGTCTLAHVDWSNERAEIGFALAPSHWGKGVMSAALPLLLDHAFTTLALNRLEADVDPRNYRSLRLLERLGFRREGLLRERHLVAGERQDAMLLGLLAADWQRLPRGA
ncbi:MAG TPA: GNAT family protein, partial [Thermoanaerobaculia bacterium]|nr:GNAT family protein [Thermoanaerobaculia bacterium]